MAKTSTSKGRTVTRTSNPARTINRPAAKAKAAPPAPKAARGVRTAVVRPRKGSQGDPPVDSPEDRAAHPTAAAERDQHLASLKSERDRVQQQHATIKDLPQYATETAAHAARLEELDAAIKELEP